MCAVPKPRKPLQGSSHVLGLFSTTGKPTLPTAAQPPGSPPSVPNLLPHKPSWGFCLGHPLETRLLCRCLSPGSPLGSSLGQQLPGLHHASLRSEACKGREARALSTLLP